MSPWIRHSEQLILQSRALQSESRLLRDNARIVKDRSQRLLRARGELLALLEARGFEVPEMRSLW